MQNQQDRKDPRLSWGDAIRSMPDSVLIKYLTKIRDDSYAPWCPPVCRNEYKCDECRLNWIRSPKSK